MKNLEQSAEELAKKRVELDPIYANGLYHGFVECGKSKWFQAEKIKAQIDILNECTCVPRFDWEFTKIGRKILQLEQELKEL